MSKRVTVLVSNDVEFDKRVDKTCRIWLEEGWQVEVIGVRRPASRPIERPYSIERLSVGFQKGFLFYAILNIRLFFKLAFKTTDVFWSNDLDTLLPAYCWAKWKKKRLIYDSHEWFTEAEGLTGRPFVKGVWLLLEKSLVPHIEHVITVNVSISEAYHKQYGNEWKVMRNVPEKIDHCPAVQRSSWSFPQSDKWIILQGAYIDPDRGAEELVDAMEFLRGIHLIIVGDGRAIAHLKKRAHSGNISFLPKMSYEELRTLTVCCDLGLSLDKPLHKNYQYSLPNKVFDYANVGIPVLVSPLPELERLLRTFSIGMFINSWEPRAIAHSIEQALQHPQYKIWKQNTSKMIEEVNWQNETHFLRDWIRSFRN